MEISQSLEIILKVLNWIDGTQIKPSIWILYENKETGQNYDENIISPVRSIDS